MKNNWKWVVLLTGVMVLKAELRSSLRKRLIRPLRKPYIDKSRRCFPHWEAEDLIMVAVQSQDFS